MSPQSHLNLITNPQKMTENKSLFNTIKPFMIGSLSGMLATSVIQPIDTVKVVIQSKGQAAGKNRGGINPIAVAREILKNNGVKGLYTGLDAAVLRQLIYAGARLGIYKTFEDKAKAAHNRNLTFLEKVGYSLAAGAMGSVIANPTDLALIRFQSDNDLPKQERRNYKNVVDAIRRIAAEEGVAGLWAGSTPTVFRAMAVNSSQLVSYNEAKELAKAVMGEKDDTMPIRLASSALAGGCVAIISLPFDNVKTKIMKMKPDANGVKPYSGFFNCFSKSIARQGITGLWIGLPTFYMRIAPHAMITVLVQDYLHDVFTKKTH